MLLFPIGEYQNQVLSSESTVIAMKPTPFHLREDQDLPMVESESYWKGGAGRGVLDSRASALVRRHDMDRMLR